MSFRIEINFSVSVVNQEYRVAVHEESVVLSNDVIFKCNIQSHVTDLVTVSGWVDSEGETYSSSRDNYGNCHERRRWILQEDDLGISLARLLAGPVEGGHMQQPALHLPSLCPISPDSR